MNAARTRIGRVTLKAGGSVRLLPHVAGNDVVEHLRQWHAGVIDSETPPDAYAAIAFWVTPDQPGNPAYEVGYSTVHDSLPLTLLVHMAAAALVHDFAAESGKRRTMRAYGDELPSWKPDEPA